MKDFLPIHCITFDEPEIITVKPVPIPDHLDPRRHHRDDNRTVNRIVDKIIKVSTMFDAMNVDAILPTDRNYFEANGDPSPASHRAYWNFVNIALRDGVKPCKRPHLY